MLQLPQPAFLFAKLLLFTTPIFLLLSALALYFLYSDRFFDARDDFSTRLGNTVARTAGSIESVLDNPDLDQNAKSDITNQLLQLLLGNQSIKCATLSRNDVEVPDFSAPSVIGCRFIDVDDWLEVQLNAADWATLRVGFSTEQVSQIRQSQIRNSITVLALSLLASILSSWFAFRVIVGRPLKALIKDIVHSRDLAEAANASKTRFLANMSHELRTPLNGVLGNAEFLKTTNLTASQSECLNTITKSGNALKLIIEDVLDFAQIDATEIKLNNEDFDLIEMVFDTISMVELDATRKGIELLVNCPTHLEYNLFGDGARFRQVFLNLLSNAIKFTSEGTVTLEVELVPQDGGAEVYCSVADTGVGISADALETIFKPFSQVNESTTRKYGGTGLGLTISRELIRMMGGELTAASSLGNGSKFTCRVPFQYGAVSEFPEEYTALKALTETRPLKVLLVDHCQASIAIASQHLSWWGIDYDTANRWEKSLPMLKAASASGEPYDVLLLAFQPTDLHDGLLIEEIFSSPSTEKTSIVLIGSMRRDIQELSANNKGPTSIVSKPLRPKMLAKAIYDTLTDHREAERLNDGEMLSSEQKVFEGVKFLLVDDHEVNLSVLSRQLQPTGAVLRLASDGLDALKVYSEYKPEVVLMDIAMPDMDGFEATKQIRKIEGESGIRPCLILAVSGHVLTEIKDSSKAAGMDGFIEKPTHLESLINTIASKLSDITGPNTINSCSQEENQTKVDSVQSNEVNTLIKIDRLGTLRSMFSSAEFSDMLATFIEHGDNIISEIEGEIKGGNLSEASNSAHRLKGSSLNLGCIGISRAMAELEQKLKTDVKVSSNDFAAILALWSDTKAALIDGIDVQFM